MVILLILDSRIIFKPDFWQRIYLDLNSAFYFNAIEKRVYKTKLFTVALSLAAILPVVSVKAGNPDRAGQAGATELLINPWARSSGWGGANSGSIQGLESQFLNVAGTAFTKKTEVLFSHTNFLQGSGISLNAFGLTQKMGESGVLGISLVSMSFGDVAITTNDQPEPSLGTYSPQYINLGISYAKTFSNAISGGFTLRIIDESISNLNASGVALDAKVAIRLPLLRSNHPEPSPRSKLS